MSQFERSNDTSVASEVINALGVIPHPEGGYFLETYRTGSEPMKSQGLTDESGELMTTNREGIDRNIMTSMIFVASQEAPILYFGVNKSDHVHYYHGGGSFTYIVVHPDGKVEEVILGGDILHGEKVQIVFPAGCFKAGHLNGNYCVIGEAVAPGFDFRDFQFVDEDQLSNTIKSNELHAKYLEYIKPDRRRNFSDYYEAHAS